MGTSIIVLLSITLFSILVVIPTTKPWFLKAKLLEKVSLCATDYEPHGTRTKTDMIYYMFSYSKNELKHIIDPKDMIDINNQTEYDFIRNILTSFQSSLSADLIYGRLSHKYSITKLSKEEYFILHLRDFLVSHECNSTFCEEIMHNVTSRQDYDYGGHWDVCTFTDYGRIYTKLLLFTCAYCENIEKILRFCNLKRFDSIKERLDSNSISISYMR